MDTKLFGRHQPGGLFSIIDREQFPTGNVWWVDSTQTTTGANSAGYGKNPDAPFLTWAYAVTQMAAGDTCYLMPGHTETIGITGAAAITLSLAGAKFIGLGGRTKKPQILIDGFADTFVSVTGADTLLQNITFKAGHADIAKGISVAAAGCEIIGCDFVENVATENFLFAIQTTNAADDMTIRGCRFVTVDAAADAAIQIVGACNNVVIEGCYFSGPYTTSCIEAITAACLDMLIKDNLLYSDLAGADLAGAIDLVANSTGLIVGNRIFHADNNDILTAIDGAKCGRLNNLVSNEYTEEGGVGGALGT